MPDHEGRPSPALLAAQRRLEELKKNYQLPAANGQLSAGVTLPPAPSPQQPTANPQPPTPSYQLPATSYQPPEIKLHPDIALAMLREGQTGSGRLWLLLRHLDGEGRGWLRIDVLTEKFTDKHSDLHLCGRRQLRNLLKEGRGVFWERDRERLWLRSAAKVAIALGVKRLSGRPVALPLPTLLGGIGQVRAHFYASFHSGRRANNPISRDKLAQITHVPQRTQRVYERAAGVKGQGNLAIGDKYSQKQMQERAWRHGRGTFPFIDHQGKLGPAGGRYVAWHLPNSYQGCHRQCPKGRQRKINRQIDLVNSGAQGNDLTGERVFHPNGLSAAKAYNRDGTKDACWPSTKRQAPGSRLWHVIPGSDQGRKEGRW